MKDLKKMKNNHEAIADIEAVVNDPRKWEWHAEGHYFAKGNRKSVEPIGP